nr:Gag-Pol polyprotein [Tanacetum cinerariifolium]
MSGPYKPTTVLVQALEATDDSPLILEHTTVETPTNMAPENKAHFLAEKEAIHLILTGIRDDIYSTVDACQTTQEMREAIERLQQGESINIQDPEWSRFLTIVKQQHKLDEVSYHKLFDILKQYQNEVNELRAEKLARNVNPLALVATTQDRNEIAKPITPPSETAYEEDSDPEQAQRDKDMQKNLALIAKYFKKIYKPTNNNLRTSSNSKNKNVDMTSRYKNDNHSGQFVTQRTVNVAGTREKECRKLKRVKDSAYHKEKMLLCKQPEQGVPLQAEQYDWLADTDKEVDEQELEAHYSYMAKIQEVPTADSGTDSELMEQNEQNDIDSDDERVALANLIANLKLDVDKNKKTQKQLKKENTTLAQELKECKAILAKTSQERPRVYSDLSPEEKDRMQLNSKFVNNMLPKWGRFVTTVKLNKGLRDSNYDQLYAYLKQHEANANENKMMLDRFTQHTVDPLALMSNVLHQQPYLQSSTTAPSIYVPPYLADNAYLNSGLITLLTI